MPEEVLTRVGSATEPNLFTRSRSNQFFRTSGAKLHSPFEAEGDSEQQPGRGDGLVAALGDLS